MWTKLMLIYLLSMSKGWPSVMSAAVRTEFDPDVDFCNNPTLSGGVVADDGRTYLFKGKYYWRTLPLFKEGKIIGYGNLTTSRWPEITNEIRLVFTVPKNGSLMTVFVVKNQWFGYQNGSNVMKGTVDLWPEFKNLSITTGFTSNFKGSLVYVLHSDNEKYILYDFKDITQPKKLRSGPTTIRVNYLIFTDDSATSMPGTSIKALINVRAGLTYTNNLYLLSKDTYCVISLRADSFERECNLKKVDQLLGCPLDISKRPVTQKFVGMTTAKTGIGGQKPIPPKNSNEVEDTVVRTGIPILGRELVDPDSDMTTSKNRMAPAEEAVLKEKTRQNSFNWFIGFVVILIVVFICVLLLIGLVSWFIHKNKRKGTLSFVK